MTFGRNHEIEIQGLFVWLKLTGKTCLFNQKNPFNIFFAASVGGGCGIHRPLRWYIWSTDAAQKMLKYRICEPPSIVLFVKVLIIRRLHETLKSASF